MGRVSRFDGASSYTREMSLIQLPRVDFSIGGPLLLKQVDLSIEMNERVCIVGRNGEGKSTLMKLIAGEYQADDGEVRVQSGVVIARMAQEVPQNTSGSVFDVVAEGLGDLATSRRGIKTVFGKMVGLLLGTQTDEERDRSAEVARGVAFALGLPREAGASPLDVRLVTRSDGGDFQRAELALEELTGEGVSVVIAGVGGASADRAKRYCEAHQVPLILLHPGSDEPAPGTVSSCTKAPW